MRRIARRQTEALPDQLPEASLEWLHSRGLPPQKLAARDCGLEGRGLVATSRIKPGEPLLRVPRALLLTASDAAAQSQLSVRCQRDSRSMKQITSCSCLVLSVRMK